MTSLFQRYPILSSWIILSAIYLILAAFTNHYVQTETLYYNSWANELTVERIEQTLALKKSFGWVVYIILPVLITFKVFFTAICIFTGNVFKIQNNSFKKFLSVSLAAEVVFIIVGLLRAVWFSFFAPPNTLEDMQQFAPLSLYALIGKDAVPSYLTYVFQTLSLFEVAYMLVLAGLLRPLLSLSFLQAIGYVLKTYGVGLLLWLLFVTFLQLQLT